MQSDWIDEWNKQTFDYAWESLAEGGYCDARGGLEYQRVMKHWFALQMPYPCTDFILRHANSKGSVDR